MTSFLTSPWPWWVAGPLLGLVVPFVYWYGGKKWGVSSNLRHLCAAALPRQIEYFRYDWWKKGSWHLAMAAGMILGGFLAGVVFAPDPLHVGISAAAISTLQGMGLSDLGGLVPPELFRLDALAGPGGLLVVAGGFLVGFGARYANGCTSGHAISGLSNLQLSSLVVTVGFFVGGLASSWILLPLILSWGG